MEGVRKRGSTIHSEAREVIRNVIECCDREGRGKSLIEPLEQATKRAAMYCKVSKTTIKRIRKEGKTNPNRKLSSPGKKRKRPEHRNAVVDDFDRRVILDTIRDFYVTQSVVPTCKKLLPVLNEKIGFKWGEWTLRRVLREMGFKWRKCASKRKVLVERDDIVYWRFEYLRQIKSYRDKNVSIFYLDETWVDGNLTFRKCWRNNEVDGVLPELNSSNRLIVVDIGSEDGFLPGGRLIYKVNCTKGDYHGQMNSKLFEKWIRNQVLPNLPENSVLVIDNAPYHAEQEDKPPNKSSTKQCMIEWLQRHGEFYEEKSTRKAILYEAILRLKPKEKQFKVDKLLKESGHSVLRLPPYMCDLNAIEYVWAQVKHHVRSKNTSGNMSLTALQTLTNEAMDSVTPSDWKKYIDHVKNNERHYWIKDGIMENAVDQVIVRLGEDSDSGSLTMSSDDESNKNDENESFDELSSLSRDEEGDV